MNKKNLTIIDNRSFLARLTILLAPQDDLAAYTAREIIRNQKKIGEHAEVTVTGKDRAARFLGSI